jgi:hypothetical protein
MRSPVLVLMCVLASTAMAQSSRPTTQPTTQPTSRPSTPKKAAKKKGLPALGAPAGVYGAGVSNKVGASVPLPKLKTMIRKLHGRPVRIEGKLRDVCRKKGCWMVLKDGKQEVRVRFKDYSFFVPRDATGREAIVVGIATEKTITEALAKHYAEEGGNPEAAKGIKGPQKILAFTATGVEILGKRTLPPRADPAPGSKASEALAARVAAGKKVFEFSGVKVPTEGPKRMHLKNSLRLLRMLKGPRTVEFSLCTELSLAGKQWRVFSSSERAFQSGFAVREDGVVVKY